MARRRKKAYEGTSVSISKSREEIDTILRKWGVSSIHWEDDFEKGIVNLRFKWDNDGVRYVARYRLSLDSDEQIEKQSVDGRSGKPSDKKYERLKAERGKREHRVLAAFLKNIFEAVDQGIIDAQAVFLPWLEDSDGMTIYERIGPVLSRIGTTTLPLALGPSKDENE